MERRAIRLPTGYLNVDAGSMSFTRTGNWAEALQCKERTASVTIGTVARVILGALLLAFVFVAGIVKADMRGHGASTALFALVLALVSAWMFFRKMKDGFFSAFKIPFTKVISLHYEKNEAVIEFVNAEWRNDVARAAVSETDFLFMQDLHKASQA